MASNKRIFYACQGVAITPFCETPTDVHAVFGVQSVGVTSNFTLDQAFEFGQVEIYENMEEVADVEVTIEKVIDGTALVYLMAARNARNGIASGSNDRCDVYLAIFDDANDYISGKTPNSVMMASGMYVSSVSYTYPVDGTASESVTLVGNDKGWNSDHPAIGGAGGLIARLGTEVFHSFDGNDVAPSGVVRRTKINLSGSTFPTDIPDVGDNKGHIQNISVSADLGRENVMELGRFGPFHRYATFPFEVTCEFEVIAISGDLIGVSGDYENLSGHTVIIKDDAGTVLDLGTKNKLSSVSYTGGDTGGGNTTITYSYSTFNKLDVTGRIDNTGLINH
jgi:hypothetical protein